MLRRQRPIVAMLAMLACAETRLGAGQSDAVLRARALAIAGERGEAITLLQDAVAASPGNSDARALLGTMLSWDGRYDEARRELETVLANNPTHGDALHAEINVELWSDHPGRAEELAVRGLRQRPTDPGYLLARAHALVALKRATEARDAAERVLAIDPRNPDALDIRRNMDASLRLWQVRAAGFYDAFSDQRAAWQEWQASVSRTTPVGPVLVRASRAQRFSLKDDQIEIDMYPRLRPGTYADVAVSYSPNAALYPQYRYAVDLYQSLGAGFEGSAGFRRLGFGSGVNIYVGSLNKYYGGWLFTGRLFVTPNSAGASRTIHTSVRRYLGGGGTYLGLRYGRGASREELRTLNDFQVLDSDVGGAEATITLGRRFELNLIGSYSRENRVEQGNVRQYSLSTGVGIRF